MVGYEDRLLDGRLKIRHLVVVIALADCRSVTRAAEQLRCAQPAVTRDLRQLEEILDARLFQRHPKGILPTPSGDIFIDYARAITGQLTRSFRHVAEASKGTIGSVSVGTHFSGADRLLPRAIRRLKEKYPEVEVTLVEETTERLWLGLSSGELDLVVGRVDAFPQTRLARTTLYVEPIELVVRAGHPATGIEPLPLEVVQHYPWILPETDTIIGRQVRAAFAMAGLPLPSDRTICTSLSIPLTLILESDAVAPLPVHMALDDSRLQILHCHELSTSRTVGIMHLTEGPVTQTTHRLLEQLSVTGAEIREHLYTPGPQDFGSDLV